MKKSKNWKSYCQTTFNSLRANVDNWGNPDFFRPITRLYYIGVFDCGTSNHMGLISHEALHNPKERTKDHCLSPQFIGRMICLLYTSPSPRDKRQSRMPSSA